MKLKHRQRLFTLFFLSNIFILSAGLHISNSPGGTLAREAVRQRAQVVTLDYNRGDILDRNGVSLLEGKGKVLVLFPSLLAKGSTTLKLSLLWFRLLHYPTGLNRFEKVK